MLSKIIILSCLLLTTDSSLSETEKSSSPFVIRELPHSPYSERVFFVRQIKDPVPIENVFNGTPENYEI